MTHTELRHVPAWAVVRLVRFPEQAVRAGEINALGLIEEVLHGAVDWYRRQVNPEVIGQALSYLNEQWGEDAVNGLLEQFTMDENYFSRTGRGFLKIV